MTEGYHANQAPSANPSDSVTLQLSLQDVAGTQFVKPPVQETQENLDVDGPTSFLGAGDEIGQVDIEPPSASRNKHIATDLDKVSEDKYGAALIHQIQDDPTQSPLTTDRSTDNAQEPQDIISPYRGFPENHDLASLITETSYHDQSASGFSNVGMNRQSDGHLRNLDSEIRPISPATFIKVKPENLNLGDLKSCLDTSDPFVSCKSVQNSNPPVGYLARKSDDIYGGLAKASRHLSDPTNSCLNTSRQTGPSLQAAEVIYPPRNPPHNLDTMEAKPLTGSIFPYQSASGLSSIGMNHPSRVLNSETLNSLSGDSNDSQLASRAQSIRPRAEHTKDFADDNIISRLSEYQTAASDQPSSLDSVDLQSKIQDRIKVIEKTIESESLMEYPQYANLQIRHQTFKTWPSSLSQSPRKLARAGFFYLGVKDHCRCYYCGNLLRDWEVGDDPEVQHELWFPDCPFVQLTKRRKLNGGNERFDHQSVDSLNNGMTRISFQEGDHALYPHIDPYICGVCGIREIGATQLFCMHIVCRKCVPIPDKEGKAWCRICGKEVVKTVAYDSSCRSICQ